MEDYIINPNDPMGGADDMNVVETTVNHHYKVQLPLTFLENCATKYLPFDLYVKQSIALSHFDLDPDSDFGVGPLPETSNLLPFMHEEGYGQGSHLEEDSLPTEDRHYFGSVASGIGFMIAVPTNIVVKTNGEPLALMGEANKIFTDWHDFDESFDSSIIIRKVQYNKPGDIAWTFHAPVEPENDRLLQYANLLCQQFREIVESSHNLNFLSKPIQRQYEIYVEGEKVLKQLSAYSSNIHL